MRYPRFLISDIQAAAQHFGGKCLSKEYINNHTPLKWMCAKGHTWDGTYQVVQRGIWCVQCMKDEKRNLWKQQMFEALSKVDGVCLSKEKEFVNQVTKLQFRCRKGHVFYTRPQAVISGHWCLQCRKEETAEKALNRLRALAEKKNGRCLSSIKDYKGKGSRLEFECEKGHRWSFGSHNIPRLWCAKCRREKKHEKELSKLNAIAERRGGTCLTTEFKSKQSRFEWECRYGHTWQAKPGNISANGSWCPVCGHEKRKRSLRKHTIEELQQIAKKRGGKLLSKVYYNPNSLMKWECYNGHTWWASYSSIYHNGSWCQICYRERQKIPIEQFQQIAKRHKGRLLSKEYKGLRMPLRFECSRGHTWQEKRPKDILNGKWCPICTKKK